MYSKSGVRSADLHINQNVLKSMFYIFQQTFWSIILFR